MLSNEDHPGLFAFMIGVIVVVFAGVSLSMLADRKFSFSRVMVSMENEIKATDAEIEVLNAELQTSTRELNNKEPKLRANETNYKATKRQIGEGVQQSAHLASAIESLKKDIPALAEEFAQYRQKYRTQARAAAVGQSLGTLLIRGGKEYHQVVINQVTDVGLEVRHENGIARIQAPDLDQSFQDKFQWNDEERRQKLNEETAMRAAITSPQDSGNNGNRDEMGSRPMTMTQRATNADDKTKEKEEMQQLRSKVIKWRAKVAQLNTDYNQASSSASYDSRSSVPGSLETWSAKAKRLSNELARARAELAAAKADLSIVAPNDPLLRATVSD